MILLTDDDIISAAGAGEEKKVFRCPECGYESNQPGNCPECRLPLEMEDGDDNPGLDEEQPLDETKPLV